MDTLTASLGLESLSMRIICLHGSRQSAQIFQKRLKTLLKKVKSIAQLHFIDAPHDDVCIKRFKRMMQHQTFDAVSNAAAAAGSSLCWWLPGAVTGEPHPEWAAQWDASYALLNKTMADAAAAGEPFDGVLGFSNGAAAAAMLLSHQAEGIPPLRFALLAGGYAPAQLLGREPLDIPCLQLQGATDEFISPEQAQELELLFTGAQIHRHEQGHCVPQRSVDTAVIIDFLRAQMPAVPHWRPAEQSARQNNSASAEEPEL